MKKKPTKADYHESADRLSIIQNNLEDYVRESKACKGNKEVVKKIDKAQELSGQVYQLLANKMF